MDIVELDVRGTKLRTCKEHLKKMDYFRPYFSGEWRLEEELFVDVNPKHFVPLLDYCSYPDVALSDLVGHGKLPAVIAAAKVMGVELKPEGKAAKPRAPSSKLMCRFCCSAYCEAENNTQACCAHIWDNGQKPCKRCGSHRAGACELAGYHMPELV
eukprot:TRINITY_DN26507_c0_g1_i1.p1 TRINITY_DN26507_c0_g1~~TRINITY_DN26507_c0_g1_i1.p1  ORF type:complete len:156 (-),score=3.94 TRINITY_DN26507_c0_g1_i1:31-498(-)